MRNNALFLVVCIGLFLVRDVSGLYAQTPDSLTLATYTYSTNTRLNNLAPLAAYLSKELRRSVCLISYPKPPSFASSLKFGIA